VIITSSRIVLKPDQKLIFAPIGDIHHNAEGHDRAKFLEIIDWIRRTALRPDRVVLVPLMGDELDTLSRGERKGYHSAGLHSSTRSWLERKMEEDLVVFMHDISTIQHLIPHIIEGNHSFTFQESSSGSLVGKTVSQIVAEKLCVPYLGVCGVNILEIKPSERTTAYHVFKLFMHHGFGVASTKGGSIQQLIKLKEKFPMCNLYIMGHNHVKIGTTTEGIDFRKNSKTSAWEMCGVVQGFVRSASFLKGYIPGEVVTGDTGSYVEEKCLNPAGLGIVTANLRWRTSIDKTGKTRYTGFALHTQE
jgi:hypothetical protein